MSARNAGALVGDVMCTAVVSAHEHAMYKEIVNAMQRNRISAVPVIDMNRRVIGVVSESDLVAHRTGVDVWSAGPHRFAARLAARRKARASDAAGLMTSPAVTVTSRTTVADAARRLAKKRVHQMPVVDHEGILVGIVGRADLLRSYLRSDAEIADDLREIIATHMLLDPATISVVVDEGIVTLAGRVDNSATVSALIAEAGSVQGVVEIVDRLRPTTPAR